jgi:hypothetical protein
MPGSSSLRNRTPTDSRSQGDILQPRAACAAATLS